MKHIFPLLLILLSINLIAQDTHTEVEKTIKKLFQGMQKGDSSMVHATFHEDLRMYSSFITETSEVKLKKGSMTSFIEAVGKPHDEVWDERISELNIQIDDNLAHAWMKYSFYLDDKFSHCGVNAMQLVKMEGEWKIINLIDTRKKDCE